HAETHAPLLAIEFQYNCTNYLPLLEQFPRVFKPLFIRNIGDVNHSFDSIAEIDKCAECCNIRDGALHLRTHRMLLRQSFPRIADRRLSPHRSACERACPMSFPKDE